MSEANMKAWTHRTEEAWFKLYGSPSVCAQNIIDEGPEKKPHRTIDFLGDVNGKRIINLLGSHGRKAVPLALLGAEVTVVDISEAAMCWMKDIRSRSV